MNDIKIVVLPQVSHNKGDRAVLHFMLEAFINNGIKEITVATSNPAMWKNYIGFRGADINFIQHAWMKNIQTEPKVPFSSLKYYTLKAISELRGKFFKSIGYSLLRTAIVKRKIISLAKLICCFCNREQWLAINEADAVITPGGHRITTYLQPDVVGHQTFSTAMAILANKKLYLWSQTIGGFEFKKEINYQLIKKILNYSERIYIRDIESNEELQKFQIEKSKIFHTYDSVFGLRPYINKNFNINPSKRKNIVGISVYTGKSNRKIEYNVYINSLAELVKKVVRDGFKVKFYPMLIKDNVEQKYFKDIIKQSECEDSCTIADSTVDTIDYIKELAKCKLFVGHKTHSIIFALLTATPLIAIAYHVKSLDFMKQFGMEKYCFEESQTSPDKLIKVYAEILPNLDNIHEIVDQKINDISSKVNLDFTDLVVHLKKMQK